MKYKKVEHIWKGNILLPNLEDENNLLESVDLFQKELPHEFYFIDRFPLLVSNNETYSQMEIYYEEGKLQLYKLEEDKFINVIRKIWVYNEVFIESSIPYENDSALRLEEELKSPILMEEFKNSKELLLIKDLHKFDAVIKLALRGKISICLVFSDSSMVLWCNDLVCAVYLGNSKNKELLQTICTTEGLYLRPFI